MLRVLFVKGLPDNNMIQMVYFQGQLRQVVLGCSNVQQALVPLKKFRVASLVLLGEGPSIPVDAQENPDLIFSEITDPDSHGVSLQRAEDYYRSIPMVPVVNRPESIRKSARHLVAEALRDVPTVWMPRTIRASLTKPSQLVELAEGHELAFPLLVRVAGMHGGATLVRVDGATQLDPLHALPMDGRDFYVTEFVDYKSPDNLYRKCRIVVVDGKPTARHLLIGDSWLQHASTAEYMRTHPELLEEEQDFLRRFPTEIEPKISDAIAAIHQATGLDYFALDGHITPDDRLLLFEANANVNALMVNARQQDYDARPIINHIATQIGRMIEHRASDSGSA